MSAAALPCGLNVELRRIVIPPRDSDDDMDPLDAAALRLTGIIYDKDNVYEVLYEGVKIGEVGIENRCFRGEYPWRAEISLNNGGSINKSHGKVTGYAATLEDAILDALKTAKEEMTVALREVDDMWSAVTGSERPKPVQTASNRLRFIRQ